jgi:sulfate permease, SulP family
MPRDVAFPARTILASFAGHLRAWVKTDVVAGLAIAAVRLPSTIAYPTIAFTAAALAAMPGLDAADRPGVPAVLALVVGGFYIGARLLGLGVLSTFLSRPILLGFFAGISLSILVGELKRNTGVDIEAYSLIAPLGELAQEAATIHADVHGLLDRADLLAAIDPAMIFDDLDDALRAFETTPAKEETR